MNIAIRPYLPSDIDCWDFFCNRSLQGTLLHTHLFLSYHKNRFSDCSLVIEQDGKIVGLFPAAKSLVDDGLVVSHPGATYGGLVHQGDLRGDRMLIALTLIQEYFSSLGFVKLLYKAVPIFYHQTPMQDDVYALFRMGARRVRCDITSVINLKCRLPLSERRRRSLKKSLKAGVEIVEGSQYFRRLWDILIENLSRKHGAFPTHKLEEIELLATRFPGKIRCICGVLGGEIQAGVVIFSSPTVDHAQYIASSQVGYEAYVLDAVFEYCIKFSVQDDKQWFDFGISTENNGLFLNDGLYRFKSEFGAGSAIHEFYELDLEGKYAAQ